MILITYKIFEPLIKILLCWDHNYRFAGNSIGTYSLFPIWIFGCTKCRKRNDRSTGVFPDKKSYDYYKELMGNDFNNEWMYVIHESFSQGIRIGRAEHE